MLPVLIEISKSVVRAISHNFCLIFSKPFTSLTKSVLTAQMKTTNLYHCTVCDQGFNTKLERKDHYRRFCQGSMDLIDLNGNLQRIERINGKFECLKCETGYNRSDNLATHWKKCQTMQETQSTS